MASVRQLLGRATLITAALAASLVAAQMREVTIAYQQIAGSLIVAIANSNVEKSTGYKVNWRRFDSGAKVATAMTSLFYNTAVIGVARCRRFGHHQPPISTDRP